MVINYILVNTTCYDNSGLTFEGFYGGEVDSSSFLMVPYKYMAFILNRKEAFALSRILNAKGYNFIVLRAPNRDLSINKAAVASLDISLRTSFYSQYLYSSNVCIKKYKIFYDF